MLVMGISGGLGHDPAAAVVLDGQLLACVEEERFIRRKHAYGAVPSNAALYCLSAVGVDMADVDCLAVSWDPARTHPHWPTDLHNRLLAHPFFAGQRRPPVAVVDHQRAHAAAAFYCSGFAEAAVVTADGQGDGWSTTIGQGKDTTLTTSASFGIAESLGFFYLALTNHLGFELGEEGKVMGLASYAEPAAATPAPFVLTEDGYHPAVRRPATPDSDYDHYRMVIRGWRHWLEDNFGPSITPSYSYDPVTGGRQTHLELTDHARVVAATGQAELERVLLHLVDLAVRDSGCRNLIVGGGVGLNCTANGVIERSGLVDQLYVFPASGDAGTSAGAALAVSADAGMRPAAAVESAALGPEFTDDDVAAMLHRLDLPTRQSNDIAADTAQLLADGRVVGWVQGRMEVGPRALGHRSILAEPSDRGTHRRVNSIKAREQWRPLAPSVRAVDGSDWVHTSGRSPFMLTACPVTERAEQQAPAVVHVDGSCRPHLVRPEANARYADLLDRLADRTGTPVVLNTSFNQASEPLVCTPKDALRSFITSELDALVIGSSIVSKGSTG